ncbi:MAG: 6-pyruvoyltetrahydropterin/6-carboxytetrahydropterin synthase [Flammeovirgaceae bacterium]|jgi:6-pyruvoyltetrahydropterin/6-carboxytetrahydropterin synthase
MVYVCRKEFFNAAHKLYNHDWSKKKNKKIFGPCSNENWHGHNFELIVTIKGMPDPERGYVMDLKVLGKIIQSKIINKVDHKNLNMDVGFLKGKMPSCEILVIEFWKILQPAIQKAEPNAKLHCVELHETRKNSAKYYGE